MHGDMVGADRRLGLKTRQFLPNERRLCGAAVAPLPPLLQPNAASVDRVCLNDRYDLLIGEIKRQLIK